MCGIAGIYVKDNYIGRFPTDPFVDYLLHGIESRGRDATGYVAVTKNGRIAMEKEATKASEFIYSRKNVPKDTKMVLLHTRFETQGRKEDNENNHPVRFGSCYAVHNGHIGNDSSVFTDYDLVRPEKTAVDSIAIPACVTHFGMDDPDKIAEALEAVHGSMAAAVIDPVKNPGRLVLVKGAWSPLVVLNHRKVVIWASLEEAIKLGWGNLLGTPPARKFGGKDVSNPQDGIFHANFGEFFIVENDEIQLHKFRPDGSRSSTSSSSSSSSSAHWSSAYEDDDPFGESDGFAIEQYGSVTSLDGEYGEWERLGGIWVPADADKTPLYAPPLALIEWTCQNERGEYREEHCIFECSYCFVAKRCHCWVDRKSGKNPKHPGIKKPHRNDNTVKFSDTNKRRLGIGVSSVPYTAPLKSVMSRPSGANSNAPSTELVRYTEDGEGLMMCEGCSFYFVASRLEDVLVGNDIYPMCSECRNIPDNPSVTVASADKEKARSQMIHIRACQEAAYEMGSTPTWINWILFEAAPSEVEELELKEHQEAIKLEYDNGVAMATLIVDRKFDSKDLSERRGDGSS